MNTSKKKSFTNISLIINAFVCVLVIYIVHTRLTHNIRDSPTIYETYPQYTRLTLDEDAIANCCNGIVGHFWLIKNELQKFVELKFEFFSLNTFDVSQIFWQRVVQPRPKCSYCILLKVLCWVSVCWILNNALLDVFWFLYCATLCHQYLAPYAVLSSKYI